MRPKVLEISYVLFLLSLAHSLYYVSSSWCQVARNPSSLLLWFPTSPPGSIKAITIWRWWSLQGEREGRKLKYWTNHSWRQTISISYRRWWFESQSMSLFPFQDLGKKEGTNGSYGWSILIYLPPPRHNKLLLLAKKYLLTRLGLNIWRRYRNIPLRLMLFGLVRMALR